MSALVWGRDAVASGGKPEANRSRRGEEADLEAETVAAAFKLRFHLATKVMVDRGFAAWDLRAPAMGCRRSAASAASLKANDP